MTTGTRFQANKYQLIMLALFGILILTACGGGTIKPDRRIPLVADQPYTGTYKTVSCAMEYQYTYTPTGAPGAGTLDFTGRLSTTMSLSSLVVRLRFLDAAGKILHTEILYNSPSSRKSGGRDIAKQFNMVPGTETLAITSTSQERFHNNGGRP